MRLDYALIVVPVMAVVGWFTPDSSPQIAAAEKPALAFTQYAIVHGEVQPRPVVEATFRFTNPTDQPVDIVELVPSCGCLRPRIEGGTPADDVTRFAPGESGTFTIGVETANEPAGPQEYSVLVRSQSGNKSQMQTVQYTVTLPRKKLTVRPNALMFYQLQGEAGEQQLEVFDPRLKAATITSVEADHPSITATVGSRGEDSITPVTVSVAAGLAAGQSKTRISIFTDDPDYPVIRIPVLLKGPSSTQ